MDEYEEKQLVERQDSVIARVVAETKDGPSITCRTRRPPRLRKSPKKGALKSDETGKGPVVADILLKGSSVVGDMATEPERSNDVDRPSSTRKSPNKCELKAGDAGEARAEADMLLKDESLNGDKPDYVVVAHCHMPVRPAPVRPRRTVSLALPPPDEVEATAHGHEDVLGSVAVGESLNDRMAEIACSRLRRQSC